MPGPAPATSSRTMLETSTSPPSAWLATRAGVVHGVAEEVVGLTDGVAGVNADPDVDRRRCVGEDAADAVLDVLRAGDCAPRTGEREHRTVALGLDDAPTLAVVASSMTELWRRRTSSHAWSPRRLFRTVESTMSVKTIVTVPSAARVPDRSGRSRRIVPRVVRG